MVDFQLQKWYRVLHQSISYFVITIVDCYKLHTTIKLLCQHCRSRCCSASTGVAWIENYHLRVDIFEEENITSIGNFQHSRFSHKNESFDAVVMMVGIWSSQSPTGTMNEGSVTQHRPVDNWFCVMLIWYMHLCTGVLCCVAYWQDTHCTATTDSGPLAQPLY